jgi:hypothetical protein
MALNALYHAADTPPYSHAQRKQQLLMWPPLLPHFVPHVTQVELLLGSNSSNTMQCMIDSATACQLGLEPNT